MAMLHCRRFVLTRCQPADIFADVLPKLGWGAQDASQKVCMMERENGAVCVFVCVCLARGVKV